MPESIEDQDERTPLLPKSPTDTPASSTGQDERELALPLKDDFDEPVWQWHLVVKELFVLLRASLPVVLAYTLQNSLQTVSVLIVGRSSPEDLATAAFSYMFAMCTAWLIGLGGTTALDTLASSTFTGSSNKHDLGVLLQRGFIVLGLLYVPVCVLWLCSEPVFLFLGQDPQLSRDSARFLTCLIPGGLGYIYFEAMKKYLQAQGEYTPGFRPATQLNTEQQSCGLEPTYF
jgi:MATE family multidrug resistance protein